MLVWFDDDSSIFAFSAASRSRCIAILSLVRSMPLAALNLSTSQSMIALVPVVAAEVVVTAGGLDLDDAVADLEQGHVEGAAAEVEDQDRLLLLALVQAVGQRGRGGLVDDAQDVQARDLPASLVAWRSASLKYAGTVITASVIVSPR